MNPEDSILLQLREAGTSGKSWLNDKLKEHIRCELVAALRSYELEFNNCNANLEQMQELWLYQMELAEQVDELFGHPNFTFFGE